MHSRIESILYCQGSSRGVHSRNPHAPAIKNNRQSLRLKIMGEDNTYLSWRRPAMWPANWFRGFCTRISSSPGQYRLEAGKAGVKRLHFLAHCCEKGLSGSNSSRPQKEGAISVRISSFLWSQKGSGVVVIGVALCLLRCFDLSADTRRGERSHVYCGLSMAHLLVTGIFRPRT